MDAHIKLAIVTGAWKRHRLFSVFCEYYQNLALKVPFKLFIAVSEKETELIAKWYGHTTVFVPNEPLGEKFNAATQAAKGADYTINIGSDDFLTEGFLRYYIEQIKTGADYIGALDGYFFDVKTKQGLYWAGYNQPYNKGHTIGLGRALSKRLLDEIDWQPWPSGFDKVLDSGLQKLLDMHEHTEHIFRMKEQGIFALDVKTEENMTPFAPWPNSFPLNGVQMLTEHMPDYANKIINL